MLFLAKPRILSWWHSLRTLSSNSVILLSSASMHVSFDHWHKFNEWFMYCNDVLLTSTDSMDCVWFITSYGIFSNFVTFNVRDIAFAALLQFLKYSLELLKLSMKQFCPFTEHCWISNVDNITPAIATCHNFLKWNQKRKKKSE